MSRKTGGGLRTSRAGSARGLNVAIIVTVASVAPAVFVDRGLAAAAAAAVVASAALLVLGRRRTRPATEKEPAGVEWHSVSLTCGLLAVTELVVDGIHELGGVADALAIMTILLVFARTAVGFAENASLLEAARLQSLTDPLTGLGNRRSLTVTLEHALRRPAPQAVFAIFDLNGFKTYNDTFGHPSGDALLVRLAGCLADAAGPQGRAFRLGGDEFCVLVPGDPAEAEAVVAAGLAALTEEGDGFRVCASHGAVVLPDEAADPTTALRLADERLYALKHRLYGSPGDPSGDALLRALVMRPRDETVDVAGLAVAVGQRLALDEHDLTQLKLAAELHDVGKVAIPDAVLMKPGELTEEEWRFVRQHAAIGQRILAAVPGTRDVSGIVRATHERWDGTGYADGLQASSIPLASRIIAVCDAYAAMVSGRPYRRALAPAEALAELRRCAGSQFDPEVVSAFCRLQPVVGAPPMPDRGRAAASEPSSNSA